MTEKIQLSRREREVVQLLKQGKSNKQIASSLGISNSTVEFHLKNIYAKHELGSRMEPVLKLGKSTVDGGGNIAENRDKSDPRMDWTAFFRDAVSKIGEELKMKSNTGENARNEGSSMTFNESILVCLKKYADFNGLASRSEFWWFALFAVLVASALMYLSEALSNVFMVAMLLPLLAAGTRRLRDSGKSGWWQLFLLAPVAGIVLVGILWAMPPTNSLSEDKLPV